MKHSLSFLILISLTTLSCQTSLLAGIYLQGEPLAIPKNPSFAQVRLILSELRALGIPPDAAQQPTEASLRPIYIELNKELENKLNAGNATSEDKIRLGGCFLRLNQNAKAIACLESARKELTPDSNLQHQLYFNLAMAYASDDLLLERAIDYQKQGLQYFAKPLDTTFPNWQFNRRSELFFLKFLQEKQLNRDRRLGSQYSISSIFGDFESEWKKNKYIPGTASPGFLDSLAPDALDFAIKLLSCFPQDNNLFWLYGEILNVIGDANSAAKVLDELVNARQMSSNPVLFEHSRILRRQASEINEQPSKKQDEIKPENEGATVVRPTLFSGDLKYLLVGFVSGIVVCYIAILQIKQWLAYKKKQH
jgi:tetratricopeptide (TPR) repeat protein